MRIASLAAACIGLALTACSREPQQSSPGQPHGRYAGVGIYEPRDGWSNLAAARPASGKAARTSDDDAVIVVVDSQTGEVRACGDLSGYCVGMNPWKSGLTAAQTAPVDLVAHQESSAAPAAGSSAAASAQR